MIKSKQMAVRDSALPYVNSSNNLVGTMNPLKFFLCGNGFASTNGSGIVDAINKFYARVATNGPTLDSVTNKIITGSTAALVIENSIADTNQDLVGAPLYVSTTASCLLVSSSSLQSGQVATMPFSLSAAGANIATRAIPDGSVTPGFALSGVSSLSSAIDAAPLVAEGSDYLLGLGIERTGDLTAIRNNGLVAGTMADKTASFSGSALASLDFDFSSSPSVTLRGDYSAAGFFVFADGLPADWKEKANFMAWNWANQNFVFPESWANLT